MEWREKESGSAHHRADQHQQLPGALRDLFRGFKQWEQFLNLDVDEYVSSLKHAVPNDEEYEEDQEPDAPSIQVDLGMLRKTLTSHVDAKAKIEEDIPAEAITAGACELNAFALRTELGDELRGNQRVRRERAVKL